MCPKRLISAYIRERGDDIFRDKRSIVYENFARLKTVFFATVADFCLPASYAYGYITDMAGSKEFVFENHAANVVSAVRQISRPSPVLHVFYKKLGSGYNILRHRKIVREDT